MEGRLISDDMINAIDRLRRQNDDTERIVDISKVEENPVHRIITPEWYFSECVKIFEDIDVDWDNLKGSKILQNMADRVYEIGNSQDFLAEEFERSFSSWYEPYHFLPRSNWGIHIRQDSLIRIAAKFNRFTPSLISKAFDSIRAAFLCLYNHQLFHYLTENAATIIELTLDNANLYTRYFSNIYLSSFNSDLCIEESLANRYLLDKVKECHIDERYLVDELSKQGPGYRNFTNYTGANFMIGLRQLMSQVKTGKDLNKIPYPLEYIIDICCPVDFAHGHKVPIWLHRKAKYVY